MRNCSGLIFVALLSATITARAVEDQAAAANAMVNAERKFYQAAQDHGVRAAFLAFLTDDAIVFKPDAMNGKEAWAKTTPDWLDLFWQPSFAVMARSGDFGFDTGPSEWKPSKTEKQPLGYGEFVSIWKRQSDGGWKVALDIGIEHPQSARTSEPTTIMLSQQNSTAAIDLVAARKTLHVAERRFDAAARIDSTTAVEALAAEDIRAFRDGVLPAVGKEATTLMLDGKRGALILESSDGDISRSGDIAYRYGRFSLSRAGGNEAGVYLQIWRADDAGRWKLALDLQKAEPTP